jgi:serine/threonine-protein kinase
MATLFALTLNGGNDLMSVANFGRVGIALLGAMTVLPLAYLGVLRSRPQLPLLLLRWMELVGFGLCALTFAWAQYWGLTSPVRGGVEGPRHASAHLTAIGIVTIFAWFIIIVSYGVYIPNTWRRAALVVAALSVTPLAVLLLAGASNKLVGEQLPFLAPWSSVMLLMAVSAAIFGSFKISALQQEAFEARQLGPYQLREHLGTGGMGEVYLAEHRLLKRPCAVKLIRPEKASDPLLLRRFEREVQATAQLTHFNTVEIFDYGHTEDGTFYYVMEYLPGPSLDELVSRHGPLPTARAVHFLRQLCGALREAHAAGLVHRDIKPSNVIVCRHGGLHDVVKLLDFGLVRTLGAGGAEAKKLTQEGLGMGTPDYVAPEQAKGGDRVDPRSDLYSLGAVAYFLLTGRPPFPADSVVEALAAHLHQQVAPLTEMRPDVPADLEAVVLGCLAKDPSERFASAEDLEEALGRCQCASQWTEAHARAWWAAHGARPGSSPPPSSSVSTEV